MSRELKIGRAVNLLANASTVFLFFSRYSLFSAPNFNSAIVISESSSPFQLFQFSRQDWKALLRINTLYLYQAGIFSKPFSLTVKISAVFQVDNNLVSGLFWNEWTNELVQRFLSRLFWTLQRIWKFRNQFTFVFRTQTFQKAPGNSQPNWILSLLLSF